jgi:alpha-galactosidase
MRAPKQNNEKGKNLKKVILGFGVLLGLGVLGTSFGQKSDPIPTRLAQTPPMGWNSWNKFRCGVNDALIRQIADAMVINGMKDAGYQYVNIDDCWALPQRTNGHLEADPATFPYGIKALADYVHLRGLKFGLCSDHGTLTCQGRAGSYGHEATDAADFVAWGVDYLKYDNCNLTPFSNQKKDYQVMGDALKSSGRPMTFSICAWEFKSWMPSTGNLWRTTDDIADSWDVMVGKIDANERSALVAGPGKWNDPDMLEVGNGGKTDEADQAGTGIKAAPLNVGTYVTGEGGMTDSEYQTQFSMWAIMAAPLIAGNNVRNMSQATKEILLNKEVIAVDQDHLGHQGIKVWDNGTGLNVFSKTLQGNNIRAVALLNRSAISAVITVNWEDIGIPTGKADVRDLWATFTGGSSPTTTKPPCPPMAW